MYDDRDELIRSLSADEANQKYVVCCWTWVNQPDCVRLPTFRLATPHGHMDFCPEHIGPMIASLPQEWLSCWAFRESVIVDSSDDIPF